VESGTATLDPAEAKTDTAGMAKTSVDTADLGVGESATVRATLADPADSVDYTLTKVETAVLDTFLGEPGFRLQTLQLDGEGIRIDDDPGCVAARTCNSLGMAGDLANPEIEKAFTGGVANVIIVFRGLTKDNLADAVVDGAVFNGACGTADAPVTCTGAETEYFVESGYYDADTREVTFSFCGIPIKDGHAEFLVESLSLPFPADPEPVTLTLCNLLITGTMDSEMTQISDMLLTGALSEAGLKVLVEALLGATMPWDMVVGLIGAPDTQCDNAEPAYSARFVANAVAVTITE
jgi:hypothetical protein